MNARDELAGGRSGSRDGRPPEILAAAAARHPGRIALACSFGAEDCLLVDTIAPRRLLDIEVYTPETGYLFPETYTLWLRARGPDRNPHPRRALAALPPLDPGRLRHPGRRIPTRAARRARWFPSVPALARLHRLGDRHPARPDPAVRPAPAWSNGTARFGLEKVNPLAAWTHDQVWAELRRLSVPVNPLHARGFAEHRLRALHQPRSVRARTRAPGAGAGSAKTECGLHLGPVGPGSRKREAVPRLLTSQQSIVGERRAGRILPEHPADGW